MLYTIHLPCYPYVKKYLEAKYPSPVQIKLTDKLGKLIYLALERYPSRVEKDPELGATVQLLISQDIYCRKGLFLSKESIQLINEMVFNEIFDEIYLYLYNNSNNIGQKKYDTVTILYKQKSRKDTKTTSKRIKKPDLIYFIEVKNVIEEILAKYNLNFNDISYESLHRAYYRRKNKDKLQIAS